MPRQYEPITILRAPIDRTCHRCDKPIAIGSRYGMYREWVNCPVQNVVFGGPRWVKHRLCEKCTARSKRQKIDKTKPTEA